MFKNKYLIKLIDTDYVLHKRCWIFWYKPMIFEDSFGLEYLLKSESKESKELVLQTLTLFKDKKWLPHYENIMKRVG